MSKSVVKMWHHLSRCWTFVTCDVAVDFIQRTTPLVQPRKAPWMLTLLERYFSVAHRRQIVYCVDSSRRSNKYVTHSLFEVWPCRVVQPEHFTLSLLVVMLSCFIFLSLWSRGFLKASSGWNSIHLWNSRRVMWTRECHFGAASN